MCRTHNPTRIFYHGNTIVWPSYPPSLAKRSEEDVVETTVFRIQSCDWRHAFCGQNLQVSMDLTYNKEQLRINLEFGLESVFFWWFRVWRRFYFRACLICEILIWNWRLVLFSCLFVLLAFMRKLRQNYWFLWNGTFLCLVSDHANISAF